MERRRAGLLAVLCRGTPAARRVERGDVVAALPLLVAEPAD
ncbi:hypothetical protein [Blastococcus capsensis]|nr:hypothetical protein [Blastococcus capsensis]MDK3255530.1 hypothetical protein [Blastococcus capsensis]